MELQFMPILVIALAMYLVSEILKAKVLKNKKDRELIPIYCAIGGAVIGAVLSQVAPEVVGSNMIDAIISGGLSGLVATGGNQFAKKLAGRLKGEED